MRKYLRFVSQSVLGMLGFSVYILADTFFIANYIGADGLASLNLALPIYGIINGTGLLIGIGGGVRYTLRHTRGDENADSVFTASLLMGAVLSFIYVLCGVFGAEHLARLLGASGTVLQPTTVYLKVCCLFSPFFILNNILTTFTRNDDAPGRAMAAMLTGSFANIMMDWYMVCVLNAGMLGAVLATGMSPIFGVAICLTRKRGYHIGKHRIFEEIPKISAAGFSAFIGEFSSTVVILIFNYLLLSLAGSTGVAAYGIIANVALVATAVLTGAAQGVQPLISIAFAEHDRRTLTKQTRHGVVTAVLLGALFTVGTLLFPQQVTAVFSKGSAELTALAVPGLMLYFLNYLVSGVNLLLIARFAAAERSRDAAVLSLLRGVILVVPCAVVLANIFGLTGLWLAVPTAEVLSLLCGLYLLYREKKSEKTALQAV